LRSEF